ncbi:MAG: hypothetical protein [Circular genetic element sp.]|nr:MAG: hypothetical protein [Circular genetic element sp.]
MVESYCFLHCSDKINRILLCSMNPIQCEHCIFSILVQVPHQSAALVTEYFSKSAGHITFRLSWPYDFVVASCRDYPLLISIRKPSPQH